LREVRLILLLNHINSAKNDTLPSLDKYLDKYCDLYYFAINELKAQGKRKIIEDYYTVGNEEMIHVLSSEDSIPRHIVGVLSTNTYLYGTVNSNELIITLEKM